MNLQKININMITKKHLLFLLQFICHCAMIYAIFNFSLNEWAASFFVYFLTGCLGVSIVLHRYYSHKTFEFKNDFLRKIFLLFSCWGLIGDPISWVNNHRQHHRLTDKEGDPHSPHVHGFIKVQWFSMFYSYDKLKYVNEMIRDKFVLFISKHYYTFHFSLILLMSVINIELLLVIYLVPACILWNAGSLVNTVGHLYGNRPHKNRDNSVNNIILGYLVWGEGWHNNHHNNPKSYKFGNEKWQLDISYHIINMIHK